MPRGIKAIKNHIVSIDDVPLRVSVFTDSAADTMAEMVEVMRNNGEVVVVVTSAFGGENSRACMQADASIAGGQRWSQLKQDQQQQPNVNDEFVLSEAFGTLPCAFSLGGGGKSESLGVFQQLLGEGRVSLFNYRQANQVLIALSLVAMVAQCIVFCTSSPDLFSIGHVLWLTWAQIPLLSLAVALRPRQRLLMLRERMPWKPRAAVVDHYRTVRFVVYAFVRLLPACAFVCIMFFWVS
jgi:hypothetical protein